ETPKSEIQRLLAESVRQQNAFTTMDRSSLQLVVDELIRKYQQRLHQETNFQKKIHLTVYLFSILLLVVMMVWVARFSR
ncbi:MAG TPA: hypothetical protein VLM37_03340, partial [Fibrobacteraceae bacterium]|nr:hypothetical protein [Fibrobacteraceae bacterium]